MLGSYRAELLKLRKRGAVWVLFAAGLVLSLIFGYLLPYLGYATGEENQQTSGIPRSEVLRGLLPERVMDNTIGGYPVFAGALALVLGAIVVGGEYTWGTLKTILSQRPGRGTVLVGQLLGLLTMIALWVVGMFAACALCSIGIAAVENGSMNWPGPLDLLTGFAGGWLVLSVWCLAGAVLAVAFRNVALPIGLGVVWILGVEALFAGVVTSLLPDLEFLADAMPGANAGALVFAVTGMTATDAPPGVRDAVSGDRALWTLLAYAAVFVVLALVTTRRRDIA
ncbi:ABC-type transport system involved in multi-copper enzyme maturation permease subunit [Kribbella sp. VKM Ac-2527]|uniref:ABC-type transport system involved in multi-copper enzyme maturation permease subunit n=1 Tax=Kribbella caucasensis TaxID=2512215 RepID=A0A4R6KHL2_9ACTN|nr:ABC transporter permease [Kribbella sp. VKM Ac-2527]TDO48624.1 ABC-type transport system involved in multi-copper enzyme maturation permease subunit [Kribbella sp. VKM Ac-2527]